MTPEQAQTKARSSLGELASMSDQTQRAERKILERAHAMLDECEAELKKLAGLARAGDEEAAKQYQAKVLDRGRLQTVVANAELALNS